MDRLDMEFPQWGKNYLLPFPDDYAPPAAAPTMPESETATADTGQTKRRRIE
jgi:hypothetical protein